MSEAEKEALTSVSKARTTEEVGEYWDTHSLGDHWKETHRASFEVRAGRRRRVTIDPEVYAQVETLARSRGISPETLVNLWVSEHLEKRKKAHETA